MVEASCESLQNSIFRLAVIKIESLNQSIFLWYSASGYEIIWVIVDRYTSVSLYYAVSIGILYGTFLSTLFMQRMSILTVVCIKHQAAITMWDRQYMAVDRLSLLLPIRNCPTSKETAHSSLPKQLITNHY